MSGSKRRKTRKWREGKGCWPIKLPGNHRGWGWDEGGGWDNHNGFLPFCLYLWDLKQQLLIRTRMHDIWRTDNFCPLWFPQVVCKPFQNMHSCVQWLVGEKFGSEINQIKHNLQSKTFPGIFKPLMVTKFQNSYSKSSLNSINRFCDLK